MTNLKDIVFETDRYWVKRVPKGFEVYKTGLTHSTRVAIIGYTGDKGLQRAKDEIARREDADPASTAGPSGRHHATKKSPAQLQREINEALVPKVDRRKIRYVALAWSNPQSAYPSQRHVEGNYPETTVTSILEGLFQSGIPEVNVEGRSFALTSLDAVYAADKFARDSVDRRRR